MKDKAWWYTSFEYRDQMGGVLVGQRNLATQSITTSFATAPLNDLLGTGRFDWQISPKDTLTARYSIERFNGTSNSATDRPIGTAAELQDAVNHFQDITTNWTRVINSHTVNRARFSVNLFQNTTDPNSDSGPQIDFPSIEDGASYRVPQATHQQRFQFGNTLDWTHGKHNFKFGGEFQRVGADFYLGVFQNGFVQAVEDFPDFDRNNDGVVNDNDILFAVGLRSATPMRPLVIPDADNNYTAGFIQDDWHIHRQLTLNLGLRYEVDSDVKDIGHYDQINPIAQPFLVGSRHPDYNNFGPRVGFNWANNGGTFSIHGGYGIYYDRITLEIQSLERGEDGRSLAIDVHAGNVISDPSTGIPVYLDPTGHFVPGAPTLGNPFSGFIIPGAGAGGIYIIDNKMQNPMVQQFNLGFQTQFAGNWVLRADGVHDLGTHFIIGVPIGTVFNPVVGGPDTVKNLESSVNTHYDALFLTVDHPFSSHFAFHSAYTLSKSLNYANDDQIPFANGPIDPTNLHREYGPTPNDQRNRLVLSSVVNLPWGIQFSPIWTLASAVPMDILLPDGSSRIPEIQRNAGGREFHNAAELNAFITQLNAAGGVDGTPLPLVNSNAKFGDSFNSLDMRLSKTFRIHERSSIQLMAECFNVANRTNVLGISNTNYSGYNNVLVRDSNDPTSPGYLHSSAFGQPVTTAGGIFGSGRRARLPARRAVQFLVRSGSAGSAAQTWVGFSHRDRRWRVDRDRHLPDPRRNGEIVGLAILAPLCLAPDGRHDRQRRPLFRRTRQPLSGVRRPLRLPPRSLRSAHRFPLRVDEPARHGSRRDRGHGNRHGHLRRLSFRMEHAWRSTGGGCRSPRPRRGSHRKHAHRRGRPARSHLAQVWRVAGNRVACPLLPTRLA